jgi:hypothetical protein
MAIVSHHCIAASMQREAEVPVKLIEETMKRRTNAATARQRLTRVVNGVAQPDRRIVAHALTVWQPCADGQSVGRRDAKVD